VSEAVSITPDIGRARLGAMLRRLFADHGIVRLVWKNRFEVAPGVWRCNQPAHADLTRMAAAGLCTVINLRGPSTQPCRRLEDRSCHMLGLTLLSIPLRARVAPPRDRLLELLDLFDAAQRPLVMHCKSGADRTGFAAALWRLVKEGDSAAEAVRQLSWRYGHNGRGRAGVQGQVLRSFAAEGEVRGMCFRDWVAHRYDPVRVTAEFAAWRESDRAHRSLARGASIFRARG
jgi:protein tyrosine phosphatase (PTP) superfamily phosphohydrolase (DUF442 family)